MLNPNLDCILGDLHCFRGFWLLLLSELITFSLKLGSQIFQNNALVIVLCTLKLILTQEHGIKLLLLLQETGCLNGKIRSIWEWDELSQLYEEFFQLRIKIQDFHRQPKKLRYARNEFLQTEGRNKVAKDRPQGYCPKKAALCPGYSRRIAQSVEQWTRKQRNNIQSLRCTGSNPTGLLCFATHNIIFTIVLLSN